jgi:hypothetical protein
MKRNSVLVLAVLAGIASSCSSSSGSTASSNDPGSPASSGNQPLTPPPQTLDRLIEEGDIVWLDNSQLYILNKTRGLSIVGLANPAAPVLVSQLELGGATPIELYLRSGFIAALTSDPSTSSGSRLSVVDVRTPEYPKLTGRVALEGQVSTSRLVGDVLYTAADKGRVIQSVNLAEPSSPRLVDRLSLPLGSQGSHVHATPNTFYVATETYGSANGMGECAVSSYDSDGCTIIMAVDISSPTGFLRLGSSYAMTGLLQDRWGIDAYDGVLRVLVGRSGWWTSGGSVNATLRTFRSRDAYQLDPITWFSVQSDRAEKVMAVRFDGPRAYVITFRKTDPLFTIDLTDPSRPFVAGHLESPGWLDFIIPRGDRLLGIGRDQDAGSSIWRLQASLYNVSSLAQPKLMARTLFGGNYTSLPDQADNYAKVVRVVPELGVLLVPYNDTSAGYDSSSNGRLEVLSFATDTLESLGRVSSGDPIVRAIPLPPVHVAAVTESAVGVIQIAPQLGVSGSVSLVPVVKQPDAGAGDAGPPDGRAADRWVAVDPDGPSADRWVTVDRDGPASDWGGRQDGTVALDGSSGDRSVTIDLDGPSGDRARPQDGVLGFDGRSALDQGFSLDGGSHE